MLRWKTLYPFAAASSSAISNLTIFSMASETRPGLFAIGITHQFTEPPGAICQERPQRSASQPHCSVPAALLQGIPQTVDLGCVSHSTMIEKLWLNGSSRTGLNRHVALVAEAEAAI
jgi:hypothetical protein